MHADAGYIGLYWVNHTDKAVENDQNFQIDVFAKRLKDMN